MKNSNFTAINELNGFMESKFEYLLTARPTAVNIAEAAERYTERLSELESECDNVCKVQASLVAEMEKMLEEDQLANKTMGAHGAEEIAKRLDGRKAVVLTHCNTGSLATGGYGTALGVVRRLHSMGVLDHVYCTETRPYNQGARLTAYELVFEGIPSTLICDSMGALIMKEKAVDAVIVGADRIVSNGDVANKIGTYQLAVAAQFHNIPFYVAAPISTIDFGLSDGREIKIEERPNEEMLFVAGKRVAAEGIGCYNPAFDVTPNYLISGIITEKGIFSANSLETLKPQVPVFDWS